MLKLAGRSTWLYEIRSGDCVEGRKRRYGSDACEAGDASETGEISRWRSRVRRRKADIDLNTWFYLLVACCDLDPLDTLDTTPIDY